MFLWGVCRQKNEAGRVVQLRSVRSTQVSAEHGSSGKRPAATIIGPVSTRPLRRPRPTAMSPQLYIDSLALMQFLPIARRYGPLLIHIQSPPAHSMDQEQF